MGTKKLALKHLELAHQSPNIGKRGKSKKTIEREELRKQFTEYFGNKFLILLTQLESAVKKGNMVAVLEVLRQLIGSAESKVDVSLGGEKIEEVRKMIETYIKNGKLATKMPTTPETPETK